MSLEQRVETDLEQQNFMMDQDRYCGAMESYELELADLREEVNRQRRMKNDYLEKLEKEREKTRRLDMQIHHMLQRVDECNAAVAYLNESKDTLEFQLREEIQDKNDALRMISELLFDQDLTSALEFENEEMEHYFQLMRDLF